MELTSAYQASFDEVKWLEGPIPGRPILTFTPKSLAALHGPSRHSGSNNEVRFVDVTSDAGLPELAASSNAPTVDVGAIATGDYDGDGTDDLFASFWSPETDGTS
jgi:hypothetical protein